MDDFPRESVQDWTTKMGLVNSSDKSLVISVEDMEATEQFSKFVEAWIKPPPSEGGGVP